VPLPRRDPWSRQGCSTKSLTPGPELENNQDPILPSSRRRSRFAASLAELLTTRVLTCWPLLNGGARQHILLRCDNHVPLDLRGDRALAMLAANNQCCVISC
jgi:hypothetical protein